MGSKKMCSTSHWQRERAGILRLRDALLVNAQPQRRVKRPRTRFNKMNAGLMSAIRAMTLEPAKPIYGHDPIRHSSGITYRGLGDGAAHKMYPRYICTAPR